MDIKILSAPKKKLSWIHILGNVDCIEIELKNLHWEDDDYLKINTAFVILDDPISRWIRAVVLDFSKKENLSNNDLHNDALIDYVLTNRITNYPNVNLQKHIIQKIVDNNKSVKVIYFQNKFNLGYLLNHFLHDNGIKNQFNSLLLQSLQRSEQINILSNFIFNETNRPYLNKVLKYLQEDYDFYNSTQFYTR